MECVKEISNFTNVATNLKFDLGKFDPKYLNKILPEASPKIEALFKNIDKIDPEKKYKHCIYIDFKGTYAKIVAAAFIAKGYHLAYDKKQSPLTEKELSKNKGKNFLFLSSSAVYGKPFGVRVRKNLMNVFNSRPDNTEGQLIRFILLDSGYREGLDCFDIKYVHILQNLITPSDEKQAIGRSTRMCGQRGLKFDPKRGWELHVYKYDISIPDRLKDIYKTDSLFKLFINTSNIDFRKIVLAHEFDKILLEAAVDRQLTKNIHDFSINKQTGGDGDDVPFSDQEADADEAAASQNMVFVQTVIDAAKKNGLIPGGSRKLLKTQHGVIQKKIEKGHPKPLQVKRSLNGVNKFVNQNFSDYKWEKVKIENKCVDVGGSYEKPEIMDFTPSQNFLRYYFQPESAYKGMLVNWSPGSGKTCTAVALASTSWERKGYTILWVTRHTLKADIWKNMFDQVCSLVVKNDIEKGKIKYPLKKAPKNYTSDAWVEPISFKQFSNLCEGKNEIYRLMVKRNGVRDPLRKTLIILDEAHKLFAKDVVGSERPHTQAIINSIQNSYKVSKDDSVRVLLMTATPYTQDPLDFVKIMNIIREGDKLPETFEEFSEEYLMDNGMFKESPKEKFMDQIAGQISYLNREKDIRQFAYPVFHSINVPLSESEAHKFDEQIVATKEEQKETDNKVEKAKKEFKNTKVALKEVRETKLQQCKLIPVKERSVCKEKIKNEISNVEKSRLKPLNDIIAINELRNKELSTNIKKLEKEKKKAILEDISQETALKKCFRKKLIKEPVINNNNG